MLTVNVIEARDLKPMDYDGTSDPYVILQCAGQKIESSYIKNTLNPVWNESYTFDITRRDENLRVVVMDRDQMKSDDFEGAVTIHLRDLDDQLKHDNWYQLQAENPKEPWQGKIRIELQWIYSRVEYMTEYLRRWEETLTAHKDQMNTIEQHLKRLRQPFSWLKADAVAQYYDEKDDHAWDNANPITPAEKVAHAESQAVRALDPIADSLAQKLGERHFALTPPQDTESCRGTSCRWRFSSSTWQSHYACSSTGRTL